MGECKAPSALSGHRCERLQNTCKLVSQGELLGPPGGELHHTGVQLSSQVAEALADGGEVVSTAHAHRRGKHLLHVAHLGRHGAQPLQTSPTHGKVAPGGDKRDGDVIWSL